MTTVTIVVVVEEGQYGDVAGRGASKFRTKDPTGKNGTWQKQFARARAIAYAKLLVSAQTKREDQTTQHRLFA